MTCVIEEYIAKQQKKGKRGGLNLPAMARKATKFMACIQADPGFVFVSQDVVALEPSITAEVSNDPMYRYATLEGIGKRPYWDYVTNTLMIDDIYLMSASKFPTTRDALTDIFLNHKLIKVPNPKGKPADPLSMFMLVRDDAKGKSFADWWLEENEWVKDYTKQAVRNFAKVACLGIGYGMGFRKFRTTSDENGVPISVAEAKGTIKGYWDHYQGLKAFRDWASWTVEKHGAVVNPFGYRCTPDPHKAMNAYIQSSASGVLDVYCLKLFAAAPWLHFVALIHDEVIYMCPEDRLEELHKISAQCVDSLNSDLGWSVPIRFGTKIGKTFADLK